MSKEIQNNDIHLCKSCWKEYPECDAEKDDVCFGDGTGNDNICACNKYIPLLEHDYERGGFM